MSRQPRWPSWRRNSKKARSLVLPCARQPGARFLRLTRANGDAGEGAGDHRVDRRVACVRERDAADDPKVMEAGRAGEPDRRGRVAVDRVRALTEGEEAIEVEDAEAPGGAEVEDRRLAAVVDVDHGEGGPDRGEEDGARGRVDDPDEEAAVGRREVAAGAVDDHRRRRRGLGIPDLGAAGVDADRPVEVARGDRRDRLVAVADVGDRAALLVAEEAGVVELAALRREPLAEEVEAAGAVGRELFEDLVDEPGLARR
ncbi:MAG: hypothetical protein H6711_09580 [Myxococcales bacterium]|nr:hypothetical protein [Myxococcales bacterium]